MHASALNHIQSLSVLASSIQMLEHLPGTRYCTSCRSHCHPFLPAHLHSGHSTATATISSCSLSGGVLHDMFHHHLQSSTSPSIYVISTRYHWDFLVHSPQHHALAHHSLNHHDTGSLHYSPSSGGGQNHSDRLSTSNQDLPLLQLLLLSTRLPKALHY